MLLLTTSQTYQSRMDVFSAVFVHDWFGNGLCGEGVADSSILGEGAFHRGLLAVGIIAVATLPAFDRLSGT